MAAADDAPRGLAAAELAAAVAELRAFAGWRVQDALPLAQHDDLLLVLANGAHDRAFLHVAPGGTRARVTTTSRRFAKDDWRRGPAADLLARELAGAELRAVAAAPGERRCELQFATAAGDRRLVVELFGARGLWALLDAEGRSLVQSREVVTAVRSLRPGDRYAPPPATAGAIAEPPGRFPAPVLASIDAHFLAQDRIVDLRDERETLRRAAERQLQKLRAKVDGLRRQLADGERAAELRLQADLMLAYAHGARRGQDRLQVPDPRQDGATIDIPLDPARPVVPQAHALYDKARRLEDGRSIAAQRCAEAELQLAALLPLLAALTADGAAAGGDDAPAALRRQLVAQGALPAAKPPAAARTRPDRPGENFRRFVSAEGYPILVGRNNEQNDRLTMRIARGNDLWLHVGGGRPGSHVVIRLPKGKTASLETLLDAGTLAVHFSKARGEPRIEVIYTHKKHVRKPKGLPAGAVVPAQTRTITVQHDAERLRRLLDSAGGDAE